MSYVKKFPQEVEKRLLAMKEAEEETRKSMASPKVAVPTGIFNFLCTLMVFKQKQPQEEDEEKWQKKKTEKSYFYRMV